MKTIRFGIIGVGMMGKEFASAAARWCHLTEVSGKPEIVALCDTNESIYGWYQDNFPSITHYTSDYHDLLNDESIDAIYCAVPHHLHEQLYMDIIEAGKHLFAEKPFGIDKSASEKILACIESHPDVFVHCTSEFPFYPAMQALIREPNPAQIIHCCIPTLVSCIRAISIRISPLTGSGSNNFVASTGAWVNLVCIFFMYLSNLDGRLIQCTPN
jgi:hypothetical protein